MDRALSACSHIKLFKYILISENNQIYRLQIQEISQFYISANCSFKDLWTRQNCGCFDRSKMAVLSVRNMGSNLPKVLQGYRCFTVRAAT